MQEITGKNAFITGGASGIGYAMAHAFATRGMKLMIADIEAGPLASAVEQLLSITPDVHGVVCDVSNFDSVQRAAKAAFDALGSVHILCNNAGVGGDGSVDNISLDTWRWVLEVNLMGVLYGIKAFLPHMRAHKQGGHIVNTASMAGMQSEGGFNAYCVSKYAVVSMSEGLAKQLRDENIGVSVLCPSYVNTKIGKSGRNRHEKYGAMQSPDPNSPAGIWANELARRLREGRDPAEIAERVVTAIHDNDLYVFTHPEWNWEVENRFAAIQAAMDKAVMLSKPTS